VPEIESGTFGSAARKCNHVTSEAVIWIIQHYVNKCNFSPQALSNYTHKRPKFTRNSSFPLLEVRCQRHLVSGVSARHTKPTHNTLTRNSSGFRSLRLSWSDRNRRQALRYWRGGVLVCCRTLRLLGALLRAPIPNTGNNSHAVLNLASEGVSGGERGYKHLSLYYIYIYIYIC
jgi:hypothetical protein